MESRTRRVWLWVMCSLLAFAGGVVGGMLAPRLYPVPMTRDEGPADLLVKSLSLVNEHGDSAEFRLEHQEYLVGHPTSPKLTISVGGRIAIDLDPSESIKLYASDAHFPVAELNQDGMSFNWYDDIGTAAHLGADGLQFSDEDGGVGFALSRTAELDPSERSSKILNTSTGKFFVSIEDVKPYADGCKVILRVGNPSFVTYHGFTIRAGWGQRDEEPIGSRVMRQWPTLKEKVVSFTGTLAPGRWNDVELLLSPAKVEEVGYLRVSIQTNEVSLSSAPKK